jgi:hypothetical protein
MAETYVEETYEPEPLPDVQPFQIEKCLCDGMCEEGFAANWMCLQHGAQEFRLSMKGFLSTPSRPNPNTFV